MKKTLKKQYLLLQNNCKIRHQISLTHPNTFIFKKTNKMYLYCADTFWNVYFFKIPMKFLVGKTHLRLTYKFQIYFQFVFCYIWYEMCLMVSELWSILTWVKQTTEQTMQVSDMLQNRPRIYLYSIYFSQQRARLPVCVGCISSSEPVSKWLHKEHKYRPFTPISNNTCQGEALFTNPTLQHNWGSIPLCASPHWDTCPQTHPGQ